MQLSGKSLVIAMCIGQVGNLLPHVVVPAVMPQHLIPLWKLSASEAGIMAGSFAIGYMLAVPVLTTLTDRLDARDSSRSVTLYTATFSVGVGLSFLVAQLAAEHFGWRTAFYFTSLG